MAEQRDYSVKTTYITQIFRADSLKFYFSFFGDYIYKINNLRGRTEENMTNDKNRPEPGAADYHGALKPRQS